MIKYSKINSDCSPIILSSEQLRNLEIEAFKYSHK